jgi:hypothetical protein
MRLISHKSGLLSCNQMSALSSLALDVVAMVNKNQWELDRSTGNRSGPVPKPTGFRP